MLETLSPLVPSPSEARAPALWQRLSATRAASVSLAAPLSDEDMAVQAEDDASPTKWHLAHVTWFFEEFILRQHLAGYRVFDPAFNFCFNSYYETLGLRHPRALRGLLTRPSVDEVLAYRAHVDRALEELLKATPAPEALDLIELGINHEQQHQELILTDILALFARHPLRPDYSPAMRPKRLEPGTGRHWCEIDGRIYSMGFAGDGFAWDNERPAHDVLLWPFALASRLVTNGEWLEFMADEGYGTAALWLADGWTTVQRDGWKAPRYWEEIDGTWHATTLAGRHPVDPKAPATHISYYEADAFARWAGCRVPTEAEWEVAATTADGLHDMTGAVWQWTGSAYLAYPGYRPPVGAVGEYNGKFMVGQHVLRGSSFATPAGHTRPTYRNFFYPHQRLQFTGLRLAKEIG